MEATILCIGVRGPNVGNNGKEDGNYRQYRVI